MKVAAIVPAYNEELRIGAVLDVLNDSPCLDEIIVVSDGSTDNTYKAAADVPGVRAIQLPKNRGKGAAMVVGAKSSDADIVVFFDADLIGLTPEHVQALVQPVLSGEAGMSMGIFHGGRRSTDWAQKIAPYITGQRAMLRKDFLSFPDLEDTRFGVEVAIGHFARVNGIPSVRVVFAGVTHPLKEEKLGLLSGSFARMKMYWEIIKLLMMESNSVCKIKKRLQISTDGRGSYRQS